MPKISYRIQQFHWKNSISYHISSQRFFTILFINRGRCLFQRENMAYSCGTEDIILIKPGMNAALIYEGGKYPLEIFCLQLTQQALTKISDDETSLYQCFCNIPGNFHTFHSRAGVTMLTKNLFNKLLTLQTEKPSFAPGLFERSILTMLIVLVLQTLEDTELRKRPESRRHLLMDDLFLFIREHITEEITLERLEHEFYVSRSHICRQFKAQTGQTVHQYIIKSKLDLCCRYLEKGLPVREVYQLGGFGGYNNFFKAFKKEYGMTPGEYFHRKIPDHS